MPPPTDGETEAWRRVQAPQATGRASWTLARLAILPCQGLSERLQARTESGAHLAHPEALTSDLLHRG